MAAVLMDNGVDVKIIEPQAYQFSKESPDIEHGRSLYVLTTTINLIKK